MKPNISHLIPLWSKTPLWLNMRRDHGEKTLQDTRVLYLAPCDLAHRRQQEEHEFKAVLGYKARPADTVAHAYNLGIQKVDGQISLQFEASLCYKVISKIT